MSIYKGSQKIGNIYFGAGKTNCLTYVPQDINLTLSNGTLTLKKGSKVYVPNGVGKFDELIVQTDLTRTWTYSKQGMMFYRYDTNVLHPVPLTNIHSGTTAPSGELPSPTCWYDITNNKVKITSDKGATWIDTYSLPLCLLTANGTQITSIDQVFNGFGYIGGTGFVLPGVKGLIPHGYNTDGTYNSDIINVTKVLLCTDTSTRNNQDIRLSSTATQYGNLDYNSTLNQNEVGGSFRGFASVGKISVSDGKIISLSINPVQTNNTVRKIARVYKGSTLVYGYGINEVLFESSTAGTSTVNIEHSGYYELTVIGGGSGGAFEYSAKYADGAAGGGSGGGLIGVAYLQAGTYSVTVGSGGAGAWDNNSREYISASAGGASKFGSIVTANGGTAATARYNNGSQTAGQGGTVSYTASAFRSISLNKQGNAGATATNASTSATYSGGESVYGGYGAGGKAQYGGAYAGGTGYVKVVAI